MDISNLTNGYHKIVLNVSLYGYRNQLPYFDVTTSPTLFLVENPIPTTTSTSIIGALISPLNITIIILAVVAIFLIVYRMHRKTNSLNQ